MTQNRFVLLDCDGGSDDAWALLVLLKAATEQRLTLLGVTICGCGNTDLHNAAQNMYRILKASNRTEIPIYLGAAESLIPLNEPLDDDKYFHGRDGFGDILPLEEDYKIEQVVQKEHAVVAINKFCTQHSKKVTIISVGPLTNIALCYSMFGAQFANAVKDIYIMGGNHQGVGNCTRCAEFNFYSDPEAAHSVLARSVCPITILPWEPCLEDRFFICINWRLDELGRTAEKTSSAIEILNKVERAQWLPSRFKSWIPCDALVVAAFLFETAIVKKTSKWHATVDLTGHTRGQMILDHLQEVDKYPKNVRIIEWLDAVVFKKIALWAVGLQDELIINHTNGNVEI
ncbi:pyrimidine-specific ribonucleoside hydrolase RihA isoform X2 [Rhagoletis pomonella]|uniref:pyrimidine-specific ribonucleoside hydrolase RihA isoform X1 n=1 Tax=Rhagoletis pomonella TaxID=28610 RepID=UPI00177B7DCE|nr:pyrimidine-specific ribonucleoside hydrolase RihA isoform X1 [Rhagoletis pomonella]XP_036317902.1 pyrimidine-specific ribonucleoside hydrolase RihA isoform X2 [Rhagoletis pomonella]